MPRDALEQPLTLDALVGTDSVAVAEWLSAETEGMEAEIRRNLAGHPDDVVEAIVEGMVEAMLAATSAAVQSRADDLRRVQLVIRPTLRSWLVHQWATLQDRAREALEAFRRILEAVAPRRAARRVMRSFLASLRRLGLARSPAVCFAKLRERAAELLSPTVLTGDREGLHFARC